MALASALLLAAEPDGAGLAGPLAFVALQGAVVGLGALVVRARRSWRPAPARPVAPARTTAGRHRPHRGHPHPAR